MRGGGTVATVVTAGSGFGELMGGISAVGDSGLVATNAAAYGAAAGGVASVILTPSICTGAKH